MNTLKLWVERIASPGHPLHLFEWSTTAMLLMLGGQLAVTKPSAASALTRFMLDGMNYADAALLLVIVGLIRAIALTLNGHVPLVGPYVRACCAAFGAFVWWQIAFAHWALYNLNGLPSPDIVVFIVLGVFELFVTVRGVSDAGSRPH